jgi:hypothetical protein
MFAAVPGSAMFADRNQQLEHERCRLDNISPTNATAKVIID